MIDEPLRVDPQEFTLDDLIWLSEWLDGGATAVNGQTLRHLRDIIVRCGNWTAEQVGGLRLGQLKETLVSSFQAAQQETDLPFGSGKS